MTYTKLRTLVLGRALTVVASQAPAAGHTSRATREIICGLGHTHRGHAYVHLGGLCQLDEQDVIVDGVAIVLGVFENLRRDDLNCNTTAKVGEEELRIHWASLTFPTVITWMFSLLEERSCSPRITRWDVLWGETTKWLCVSESYWQEKLSGHNCGVSLDVIFYYLIRQLNIFNMAPSLVFSEPELVNKRCKRQATCMFSLVGRQVNGLYDVTWWLRCLPDIAVSGGHHPVLVDQRAPTEVKTSVILEQMER